MILLFSFDFLLFFKYNFDHLSIRVNFFKHCDEHSLYNLAKTCWFLHDDAVAVLRERALQKYGIADSLLHLVLRTYAVFGKAQLEYSRVDLKETAIFAITQKQINALDISKQYRWTKKGAPVVDSKLVSLKDVILASIERFGCLGQMQVYRDKLLKQRQERRQRMNKHRFCGFCFFFFFYFILLLCQENATISSSALWRSVACGTLVMCGQMEML